MNISISTSKTGHPFLRIKGCFFIINVTHTKTFAFSFLLDEIGWSKNNRQVCLQYIIQYIHTYRENTREEQNKITFNLSYYPVFQNLKKLVSQ